MPNKRRFNVPHWYGNKFPEHPGQSLTEFLRKMDRLRGGLQTTLDGRTITLPWKGYDKTPLREKAEIWARIYRWVQMKAKHLGKLRTEMWKRGVRTYKVVVVREKGKFKTWVPVGLVERKVRGGGYYLLTKDGKAPRAITHPVSDEEFDKMTKEERDKYLYGD